MTDDELNVTAYKVKGFQTSRGFAGRADRNEMLNDIVGLTLSCEDLERPGYFIMAPHEAEELGQALIDSARKAAE